MTQIVGGLRSRLIKDSIQACIYSALSDLGWFATGRQHKPIVFAEAVTPHDIEIALNTLTVSDEAMHDTDLELGSTAVQTRWVYYVDFYAEDDVIGKHVINDIRDALGGRMSTIGRGDASIRVYDYRQATPPHIFTVDIANLVVDRAHDFPKPWQRFWYACRFDVLDAYGDETS